MFIIIAISFLIILLIFILGLMNAVDGCQEDERIGKDGRGFIRCDDCGMENSHCWRNKYYVDKKNAAA